MCTDGGKGATIVLYDELQRNLHYQWNTESRSYSLLKYSLFSSTVGLMELPGELARLSERLVEANSWGYAPNASSSTEPVALAALALLGLGLADEARTLLNWLHHSQQGLGSVGVFEDQADPIWPTSLAVIAWRRAMDYETDPSRRHTWETAADRGIEALLEVRGETWHANDSTGHDPSLAGWPWVIGTHSWSEPTAYAVLALRASEMADHPRARDGAKMLYDRLLPDGGCNYGNTVVLGQTLRPHLGPTGIVLAALAGEADRERRITKSLEFLNEEVGHNAGAISLCQALIGLTAHDQETPQANDWLASKARMFDGQNWSAWKAAWMILAGLGQSCPLLTRTVRAVT
jgi:hypothetical protein